MQPRDDQHAKRYEVFQPSFAATVAVLVLIAIAALISHAALWDWWTHLKVPAAGDSATRWQPANQAQLRTVPALQIAPAADLQKYRAQQSERLSELAWVDKSKKKARVPVEIAMEAIMSNGLPQWSTNSKTSPLELQWQRAGSKGGEQ